MFINKKIKAGVKGFAFGVVAILIALVAMPLLFIIIPCFTAISAYLESKSYFETITGVVLGIFICACFTLFIPFLPLYSMYSNIKQCDTKLQPIFFGSKTYEDEDITQSTSPAQETPDFKPDTCIQHKQSSPSSFWSIRSHLQKLNNILTNNSLLQPL